MLQLAPGTDTHALPRDAFFDAMRKQHLALTFYDLRLRANRPSDVSAGETNLRARLSRRIVLPTPLVSAAMDTVTDWPLAVALAKLGGIGIIHRAMESEQQGKAVARVKHHLHGLIKTPITVAPGDTISGVVSMCREKEYGFRTFPVIEAGSVVGILTGNDIEFAAAGSSDALVRDVMTTNIVTGLPTTTAKEALALMRSHKKKMLPLVDENNKLVGLYILSDVRRVTSSESSMYSLDAEGRLRVGAAVGTSEADYHRVAVLVSKGADLIVVDTARGDSNAVCHMVHHIKGKHPEVDVMAGNVSEGESAKRLVDAGADAIKVGQGGGAICTTRTVAGIGCPQVTAIAECERAIRDSGVPLCADGGIQNPGDIPIAIGAGADTVMMGAIFAAANEAPGKVVMRGGVPHKYYRGMGSAAAMAVRDASATRYPSGLSGTPEGVEGLVPSGGPLASIVSRFLGGLRQGMGYVGAPDIPTLQKVAMFWRITENGVRESGTHGIIDVDGMGYGR